MLRLLGSSKKLCDGLTRRDFLEIGSLGPLGVSLIDLFRCQRAQAATPSAQSFGKARACILLFPYGSPPQHETFDPKPEAPVEIQGEMKATATNVPGVQICEHLPNVARLMDRVTVVRSMSHPYAEHGVAYALSGIPTYTPVLETRPRDPRQWPFIGSVVDYLQERRTKSALPGIPRNMGLPWMLNAKTDFPIVNAGPFAAFLGQGYDPVWAHFHGKGTRLVPKYGEDQKQQYEDPFGGVNTAGRFQLSPQGQQTGGDVAVERIDLRRSLLEQFDRAHREMDRNEATRAFDKHRQLAYSLLTSSRLRQALDIGREPLALRESYGMTLFGQACLAARRLVEAGSKFVTVFWDGYGRFSGCAWDTHANHYPRLKEYLLPGFDRAYAGLLRDLEARGLLDETLVLCMSEHGRTPKIDSKPKGAGRHHWSRAYSAIFAGGGVARGKIVGRTDRLGGEVRDTPISPKDILATAFHLLGIDPNTTIPDRLGRPFPIAGDGTVRPELLG
jgi:hypothetical protein